MLKATHVITPLVALAAVGVWNTMQVWSISSLKKEGDVLRRKLAMADSYQSDGATRAYGSGISPVGPGGKIDWKQLAATMADAGRNNGFGNLRDTIALQQRLLAMTRDEMSAALDEIAKLDLTDEAREELEAMIIDPLIAKDPEFALNRFVGRLDDGTLGWHLSGALGEWAKKDPSAAIAWFDKQIAAGTFDSKSLDGKSQLRVQFEAALIGPLLSTDPTEAGRRISAMPETQRREILEQLQFNELDPTGQKNYAGIVRQFVPADEREGSFAHIAAALVNESGLDKVTVFLDAVQATPAERAAAARQTVESRMEMLGHLGELNAGSIDDIRMWLNRQAPGQTDTFTGRALAEAAQSGGKFDYSTASQLVLKYNQHSADDAVLIAFLQGYQARSNLEEARELARMIADETRRAEILGGLK